MKKEACKSIRRYIAVAVAVNAASLAGAGIRIYTVNGDLSFGGFAALFFLLMLALYFLVSAAIVAFLLVSRRGKTAPFLAAGILQALAPIPWLAISDALGGRGVMA